MFDLRALLNSDTGLLTAIIFLPALGALVLAILPKWVPENFFKLGTLAVTIVTCVLCFSLYSRYQKLLPDKGGMAPLRERAKQLEVGPPESRNDNGSLVVRYPWIRSYNIEYYLGVDGISLSLVVLTGVLSVLSMLAAFSIYKFTRGFCILYLLLETGMMGTFLSLDFFLFYVFWELMLLPMYFLIGVWGGPRREYAAIKFFLYTLVGSVLMLIAMLGLYFTSAPHTFDLLKLQEIGQQVILPNAGAIKQSPLFSVDFQKIMFVLLFIGFAVKIPIVPFHTWLPDAHVEAPTPISMILAGVLLKMGGYGLIRIAYPICPAGAQYFALYVAIIGVVSILYGAFAAMAQTDFKKLVAYSSVSHMGYVTLGLAIMGGVGVDYKTYAFGVTGAMYQMIAHGVSSAGMFFLVGVIYERAHHRDLNNFGGLMNIMPRYGAMAIVIFFAGMGLPGLCGFIGEFFTVLASFRYDKTMGILAALGVILTAAYILWSIQRVFLGSNPKYEGTPDINFREMVTIIPLVFLAILLGVYPNCILSWLSPDIEQFARDLSNFAASNSGNVVSTLGR